MKMYLTLLLIVATSQIGSGQTTTNEGTDLPFSITISTSKTEVEAGSSVHISIRLTNNSDHEMSSGGNAYAHGLDTSYFYVCSDNGGKAVVKERPKLLEGVGDRQLLKPGESYEEDGVPIGRACDLTKRANIRFSYSEAIPAMLSVELLNRM